MTAQVIRLFDHSRPATPVLRARVAYAAQRMEQRRLFNASIELAQARNALGLCAQCERPIRSQSLLYFVPSFKLSFCIACGVRWRDEIYPLLKGT